MTRKVTGIKATAGGGLGKSHCPLSAAGNARPVNVYVQCPSPGDEEEQGLHTLFSPQPCEVPPV